MSTSLKDAAAEVVSETAVEKSASASLTLTKNWKTIAIAAASSISLAALVYCLYRSSSASSKGDSPEPTSEQKKSKNKKRSKAKRNSSIPKPSDPQPQASDDSELENMTDEQIAQLSETEKKNISQKLKGKGNKFFQAKEYQKAEALYSSALRFDKNPIFYSNRAACYYSLQEYEKSIEDCNDALKFEPRYVKALVRRAQSYENINNLREALYDFTTVCIIEDFKNSVASTGAERVLKNLAESEAKATIANRQPRLPSRSFISGYFNSFTSNGSPAVQSGDSELSQSEKDYNQALELASAKKFSESIEFVQKAINGANTAAAADAYSLMGAFNFLKGSLDLAEKDFDTALNLNPKHCRTLYRKANMLTEKKDIVAVENLIQTALEINPVDPEGYFQSGQVSFLKQDFDSASKKYQKAIDIDPNYVYPYIQLGVALFKLGSIENAFQIFKSAMSKFPNRSDLFNYYGEVLAEQGGSTDAIKSFEDSIRLDKSNPLPYVNKAISTFQSSGNFEVALDLIKESMNADPECELAIAALSQIYLQLGMFEDSLVMLRRAVEVAKSEDEMISTITFRETTAAQYRFIKEHPDLVSKIMNQ
ncbi:Mitochondrial import receptor subunit tom70 [Smittium culicis]|uniref:Mitochondrial import receptor subunit tom70 n=1 Tax=Smittium culicis TaxID=133412 RepID=A0A1R1YQ56_9FUNG|nr:Mitochondrial import receptor subunit tom70 [Smittium culicis]